ncbi:hypothetical protein, partial [Acinetobacter ursingii]|uniref:hypothetical protein n=1 Tax=Acinetobacter ursingii TaxID=108980 RepID=UPI00148F33F9
GIDLAFPDHNAEEIVVIQAHCPENLEKKTPKGKWDALLGSIPYIKDPSRLAQGGRLDLAETISQMQEEYPNYPISVGLVTLGKDSPEIRDSLGAHSDSNPNEKLSYFYFSQEDIDSRYRSIVSSGGGIARDTLNFSGAHFTDSGDYG